MFDCDDLVTPRYSVKKKDLNDLKVCGVIVLSFMENQEPPVFHTPKTYMEVKSAAKATAT